jgi:hypothetical protein
VDNPDQAPFDPARYHLDRVNHSPGWIIIR